MASHGLSRGDYNMISALYRHVVMVEFDLLLLPVNFKRFVAIAAVEQGTVFGSSRWLAVRVH